MISFFTSFYSMRVLNSSLSIMTIDAGWTKIIKTAIPHAFQKTLSVSQKPRTVFVDGQIKLMCSSKVRVWSVFFKTQFLYTIDKAFDTGADTVVIGFDNYNHVPTAKNMTQAKRAKQSPAMDFTEHEELPPIMPDDWYGAMRNRTFKVKVIQLMVNNIRQHYLKDTALINQNKSIIIDFTDTPEVIGSPRDLPDVPGKRGECDIKAFSWLGYGPLLIVSTDGDFLPISLIQLEQLVLATKQRHHVYLLRMVTNTAPAGTKRPKESSFKREYEYVDMLTVLSWVSAEINKAGMLGSPARNFAALVAVTGCDFAMNLPNIGPHKLWEARNHFHSLDVTFPQSLLLALTRVYHGIHHKQICAVKELSSNDHDFDKSSKLYEQVSSQIKGTTKISARTQERTWNKCRMTAHVQNAHWTLQYWTLLQYYPDPLAGSYGFERKGNYVIFGGEV